MYRLVQIVNDIHKLIPCTLACDFHISMKLPLQIPELSCEPDLPPLVSYDVTALPCGGTDTTTEIMYIPTQWVIMYYCTVGVGYTGIHSSAHTCTWYYFDFDSADGKRMCTHDNRLWPQTGSPVWYGKYSPGISLPPSSLAINSRK